MRNTIKLSDFSFQFTGYGHYKVTFTSPKTGKKYTKTTSDMQLIDATKNAESPKINDLNTLKYFCKN
jgi:hypothetical protein